MTLRTATASDLSLIMELERASFPTDAWSEAMMAAELASPHGRYVVDVEAGRLVGYGGVRAPQGGADADIQTIAIAADARGTGRGRALLTELLTIARERGAREVFLEVRADNPVAEALYASEGFVEIARRPRYYQPDDVDAVVMKLDLPGWAAARAEGAVAGSAAFADPVAVAGPADPGDSAAAAGPAKLVPLPGAGESDAACGTGAKGWC